MRPGRVEILLGLLGDLLVADETALRFVVLKESPHHG